MLEIGGGPRVLATHPAGRYPDSVDMSRRLASLLVPCLLASALAWAHGPVDERIAIVGLRLKEHPEDAGLRFERAELLRVLGAWDAAAADYAEAERLAPADARVPVAHARMLLEAQRPAEARVVLEPALARQTGNAEALWLRARARAALGDAQAAALDFERALPRMADPQPEHYLARARAQSALGRAGSRRALAGLEQGLRRLGPAVTLELAALQIEQRLGRGRAALRRVDRLLAQAQRRSPWLERRGLVLWRTGRRCEARAAFEQALRVAAHEQRAGTAAAEKLRERLAQSMAALQDGAPAPEVTDVL